MFLAPGPTRGHRPASVFPVRQQTRRLPSPALTAALAVAVALAGAPAVAADVCPGSFRQIDCDGAGWFTNLIVHPTGRLYGRTDVGGVYRSDDHGNSWRFLSGDFTSPSGYFVQGVAAAPGQADAVYICLGTSYDAGGPERGIWKSADGGGTWTQVKPGLNFSGNDEPRWGGECIAIHPADAAEVWAGSRAGGLWRSRDAGATWTQVASAIFGARNVVCICLHPGFPDQVWVGCEGGVWASPDRGATWAQVRTMAKVWRIVRKADGTAFINGGNADPNTAGDSRLWRVTATNWANPGSYVYTDVWPNWLAAYEAAKQWQPFEYNPGLTVLADGSVAAGTIYESWARSTDDGSTWTLLPLAYTGPYPAWQYAPPPAEFTAANSLVQDPTDLSRWFFAGGWGPARSEDAGATCRHIVGGIGEIVAWQVRFHPTDPQRVYLPVADMGLACVTDGGNSGDAGGFIYPHFPWPDDNVMFSHRPLVNGARIIAPGGRQNTHQARLYVSYDHGATWGRLAGGGLPTANNREIVDAVAAPDDPDDFLVSAAGTGGVYRTTDGGATFTKSTGLPGTFNAGDLFWWDIKLERDAADPARRYAMLRNKGLYVSTNRGATWTKPAAQPPDNYGFIVADPATGGRLWFYNEMGLFRSADGGTTWSAAVGGFTAVGEADACAGRLAVLGRRAGEAFDQVFYSADDGANWRTVTRPGLRFGNAQAVAVDPWRHGTVWISTSGRSVARFTPWTALEIWRDQYFSSPANSGPGADAADPEGDGLVNLIEYALGSPPVIADAAAAPTGFVAAAGGMRYPALRVVRTGRRSDVTYTVEVSADLRNWASGPGVTTTATDAETLLEVRANQSLAAVARCYLRLRVTVADE